SRAAGQGRRRVLLGRPLPHAQPPHDRGAASRPLPPHSHPRLRDDPRAGYPAARGLLSLSRRPLSPQARAADRRGQIRARSALPPRLVLCELFLGIHASCIRAMLATVGFETLEVYTWALVACFVCAPR